MKMRRTRVLALNCARIAPLGLIVPMIASCGTSLTSDLGAPGGDKSMCANIHVGTQDQVINTAVGGAVSRELKMFEKNLPSNGAYKNLNYDIQWSSYTSGPPITNKMIAGQIQIGLMGDFPAVINLIKSREGKTDSTSTFIGTLAYSPDGAGNAVVVPKDSKVTSLKELKGATVSVPFGSAAHGMVLKALSDAGLEQGKNVTLISQSPEVGGSSLKSGQIDAHADFVPFGELFPYRGFARKIFDGAQTGVPTLHGIIVRDDFAKACPEVVTAFMKSVLQANEKFREEPEKMSAKIEGWSGIEKEVVYMFLGPSGLQPLSPEIGEIQLLALENSIATLKGLGKIKNEDIKPSDVREWVDDSYLKAAAKSLDTDVGTEVKKGETYVITGKDALDGSPITDPTLSAQIWVSGDEKISNYSSISSMVKALNGIKGSGKGTDVIFVHDKNKAWKLLASNAYYVRSDSGITAFLLKTDAETHAKDSGGVVMQFEALMKSS